MYSTCVKTFTLMLRLPVSLQRAMAAEAETHRYSFTASWLVKYNFDLSGKLIRAAQSKAYPAKRVGDHEESFLKQKQLIILLSGIFFARDAAAKLLAAEGEAKAAIQLKKAGQVMKCVIKSE